MRVTLIPEDVKGSNQPGSNRRNSYQITEIHPNDYYHPALSEIQKEAKSSHEEDDYRSQVI